MIFAASSRNSHFEQNSMCGVHVRAPRLPPKVEFFTKNVLYPFGNS